MVQDQSLNAHVVGIAMGEEGLISRVLSPRAGAAFTFASLSEGSETAPGQVSARSLLDIYRLEQIDQATRIFGVAGNPIAHSLSPLMHVTAFRRENVNAVMLPLKVKTLDDLLAVIRDLPLDGVAVTMPLKQEVHRPHRRLQHAPHRRRRQALRLQYRCGRHYPPAGAAHASQGCAHSGARRRRRSPRSRLRPRGAGR
jgi:hypothetical protein